MTKWVIYIWRGWWFHHPSVLFCTGDLCPALQLPWLGLHSGFRALVACTPASSPRWRSRFPRTELNLQQSKFCSSLKCSLNSSQSWLQYLVLCRRILVIENHSLITMAHFIYRFYLNIVNSTCVHSCMKSVSLWWNNAARLVVLFSPS